MEPLEPRPQLRRTGRAPEPAGVPRRFGVGTLLTLTAAYAGLFSLLRTLGAPPMTFLLVAGFCTLIGLGQMLLFGGKKPRLASFLVGGLAYGLTVWGAWLVALPGSWRGPPFWVFAPVDVVFTFVSGGMVGYVVGCLIAGIFLVLRQFEKRRRDTTGKSPFAAADEGHSDRGPE